MSLNDLIAIVYLVVMLLCGAIIVAALLLRK